MLEYTWEILSLYTASHENGMDNVVKKVNWRYQVTDGQYYGDIYQHTEMSSPDPDKFIVFESLTDETIVNWLKETVDVEELNAQVTERLESNKTPQIVEKIPPWEYPIALTGEEEYLLVVDDQPNNSLKIWGPLRWDSGRMNAGLKERGLDVTVPDNMTMFRKGLVPVDAPLVLSDRAKIYRVEYTPQPEFDEIFQRKENLSWVTTSGRAVGMYFVFDKTLDEVKETLKEKVKNQRNNKLVTPATMQLNGEGVSVYLDPYTYLITKSRATSIGDQVVAWKLVDKWIQAGKSDLEAIAEFIENKTQQFIDEEYAVVVQIDQCTTVDQLRAVNLGE